MKVQFHGNLNRSKSRLPQSHSPTTLWLYMPDLCFEQAQSAWANVWDAKRAPLFARFSFQPHQLLIVILQINPENTDTEQFKLF